MSSLYGDAVRYGGVQYAVCDAWRDGQPLRTDLAIVSGSITDDSSGGVRRTLNIEIFPELGLWDLLVPIGTELRPRSVTRYPSGDTEQVPMGVFPIDDQDFDYGPGGSLKLQAPDKWSLVQKARFLRPQASAPGALVTDQIATLIRGGLGADEPVVNNSTSTATVGSLVWERDRDKAIEELAKSIGCYVSFDRNGVATIDPIPTSGATAVWTVDASETGVLLTANRNRSRKRTYNVVVVTSDKADGDAPFDPVIMWDNDPASATYAGPDPVNQPELAGPLGVVPYFYTSPLLTTASQAEDAGRTILARTTGMASKLSMTAVPNHALDSFDVIDALLPAERYDQEQPLERHIIDRVSHPFYLRGAQDIDARSTREDEFS